MKPKYRHGDFVWFLKSMRMCKFISHDGGNTCTVERLDNGKRLTAIYDGIELSRTNSTPQPPITKRSQMR